jgi:hypothetical protein
MFSTPSFVIVTSGNMRFQVLTEASMKMAAFWDVAPCNLVKVEETSVHSYETTLRYIPKGCRIQLGLCLGSCACRETVKSYFYTCFINDTVFP